MSKYSRDIKYYENEKKEEIDKAKSNKKIKNLKLATGIGALGILGCLAINKFIEKEGGLVHELIQDPKTEWMKIDYNQSNGWYFGPYMAEENFAHTQGSLSAYVDGVKDYNKEKMGNNPEVTNKLYVPDLDRNGKVGK